MFLRGIAHLPGAQIQKLETHSDLISQIVMGEYRKTQDAPKGSDK